MNDNAERKVYVKMTVLLSALALLLGVGAALLSQTGILLVAPLAAIFASLFLTDKTRGRLLSIALSAVTVAVELAFNLYLSFNCLTAVLLALVIVLGLRIKLEKSVTAAIATVLVAVIIVAYLLLGAIYAVGAFNIDAALEYLTDMIAETRNELHAMLADITVTDRQGVSVPYFEEEVINATLDTYFSLLPSIFVVLAFAMVGIAFKIFGFIIGRCGERDRLLGDGWVFGTTALFAYFFLLLALLQIFVYGTDAFSATVLNLYVVFTAVYAYVGYRFASYMLFKAIRKPLLSKFLVILSILFFAQLAVQILSYAGVFETVITARIKREGESDGTNQSGG